MLSCRFSRSVTDWWIFLLCQGPVCEMVIYHFLCPRGCLWGNAWVVCWWRSIYVPQKTWVGVHLCPCQVFVLYLQCGFGAPLPPCDASVLKGLPWKPGGLPHRYRVLWRLPDSERDFQAYEVVVQPHVTQMIHRRCLLETGKGLCMKVNSAARVPVLPCATAKSEYVSSPALLLCWFIVTLIQLNCDKEVIVEVIVVCFPKAANNPIVSAAGGWKLACKLGTSSVHWYSSWNMCVSLIAFRLSYKCVLRGFFFFV